MSDEFSDFNGIKTSYHIRYLLGSRKKKSVQFASKLYLSNSVTEHSNRPYPCPHCPHRSKTRDKLERHLLSHSTPRESYQCQHCEKNFAFKNSLKKHLEKGRCDVLKRLQKDNTYISNNVATIMGMNMTDDLDLLS